LAMAGTVLERALAREPHPENQSIKTQSTPAQKYSPILGSVASTERKNDPMNRMGEPPVERDHGSKLPADGWFGEPKPLPMPSRNSAERPKQAPRAPMDDSVSALFLGW
jgi:hypothetical protein